MSQKDLDLDNLDLDDLDVKMENLSIGKLQIKKSSSSPPPPGFNHSANSTNNSDSNTYEYYSLFKKYNPRLADLNAEWFYANLENKNSANKEISVKEKNENDLEWNKNVNSNKINGFAPFASFKCKPLRKNECNFLDEGNKYEKRNNIEPFNYNNNSSQQYKNYFQELGSFEVQNQNNPDLNNIFNTYYMQNNNDANEKNIFKLKNLWESKRIQTEFENGDETAREKIFLHTLNNLFEMINDTYNNYIIQKILEKGSQHHKKIILNKLKPNFAKIAMHKFGCRIIQKCIEGFLNRQGEEEYIYVRDEILKNINFLMWDENGNLVVLKCLEKYNGDDFSLFLDYIQEKFQGLCLHKTGCLTLQKLADVYFYKDQSVKMKINEIIFKVIDQSYEMSKKEYSNYIIQHILEAGHADHKTKLLYEHVLPNFISLSCDQYASNVSEKAIINSEKEFRKKLWDLIFKNNNLNFSKIVNDKYGNYVMQRIYEYSEWETKDEFIRMMNKIKNSLNSQGQYVSKFIQNHNSHNNSATQK